MKQLFLNRCRAFRYAFQGLRDAFTGESVFIFHLIAVVLVIITGLYFQLTSFDWTLIVFSCALVLVSELVNTAIERLSDKITRDKDEDIRLIKDISAAAVLIAAMASILIAVFVFYPYIKNIK